MKQTLQKTSLTIIGLFVMFAGTYVFAGGVWNNPSTTAPNTNVSIPIHEGTTQIKDGGLAVNAFLASQNALFKQEVFFRGPLRAINPVNGTETIAIGSGVTATGDVTVSKNIKSVALANTTGTETLCADTSGQIVICQATVPPSTQPPTTGGGGNTTYTDYTIELDVDTFYGGGGGEVSVTNQDTGTTYTIRAQDSVGTLQLPYPDTSLIGHYTINSASPNSCSYPFHASSSPTTGDSFDITPSSPSFTIIVSCN